MGLVISAVIVASSWSLLRQSLHMAMDGVPEGLDRTGVEAWLARPALESPTCTICTSGA